MYSLTIHFGPNAVAWSFLFREEEKAAAAIQETGVSAKNLSPMLIIADDFGQKAGIMKADIHGILVEDLDAGQEARIIRGIDNARGQLRANKRAQSDPEIQALAKEQQRQSPGIISPMGPVPNGGFHRQ